MATAISPTLILSESAIVRAGSSFGTVFIFITARSVAGSLPISSQGNSRRSERVTFISVLSSITWLLVITYPLLLKMTPEPFDTGLEGCLNLKGMSGSINRIIFFRSIFFSTVIFTTTGMAFFVIFTRVVLNFSREPCTRAALREWSDTPKARQRSSEKQVMANIFFMVEFPFP